MLRGRNRRTVKEVSQEVCWGTEPFKLQLIRVLTNLHAAVSDEAAQLAKRLVERPEFQDKYNFELDDTNTDGVPIPRNIGTYGMIMQLIVVNLMV